MLIKLPRTRSHGTQHGMTLMELLIAMAVSLIASLAMVMLMANSLGSATKIMQMERLSQQLRAPLQIMTRDLRRANYNAEGLLCFGNPFCGDDGDVNFFPVTATDDCLIFRLDRTHDNFVANPNAGAGAFRRRVVGADDARRGVLEMWVNDGAAPADCASGASWLPMTNARELDVTAFNVETQTHVDTGEPLTYTEVIMDNAAGTVVQQVRKIHIVLSGRLIAPNVNQQDMPIYREIGDVVHVRNNLITRAAP